MSMFCRHQGEADLDTASPVLVSATVYLGVFMWTTSRDLREDSRLRAKQELQMIERKVKHELKLLKLKAKHEVDMAELHNRLLELERKQMEIVEKWRQ